MVQALGAIDILAGALLIATAAGAEIPILLLVFIGICLIAKAALSILNFFGWIDLAAFILLIVGIFVEIPTILLIVAGIMIVKGGVSMFS